MEVSDSTPHLSRHRASAAPPRHCHQAKGRRADPSVAPAGRVLQPLPRDPSPACPRRTGLPERTRANGSSVPEASPRKDAPLLPLRLDTGVLTQSIPAPPCLEIFRALSGPTGYQGMAMDLAAHEMVRKQFSHCASTFGGSVDIEACKKAIESGRLRCAETGSLAEICSLVCPAQCIRFEIKIDPPSFQGCQPKKSIDSVHDALCGRVCQKDRVLDIPSTQLQSSHSGPCQS
jgi:hypothetical protein